MKSEKYAQLHLGAHMSIAGSIDQAIDRALSIGCTALQIFTASNRSWSLKDLSSQEIELFKAKQKQHAIPVVSHCSYLINLASPNKLVQKSSRQTLLHELKRCHALGIKYAVLHPGSKLTSPEKEALQQVAKYLDEIITEAQADVTILLETMAGQGNTLGNTFEQLAYLRDAIHHKKFIGICADTCHLFASGYKFSTPHEYKELWQNFDAILGLERLKVIHINDSKKECGARADRHDHIGQGKIGLEAFSMLMNDPNFATTIKIIETPKTSLEEDFVNLKKLKDLIK